MLVNIQSETLISCSRDSQPVRTYDPFLIVALQPKILKPIISTIITNGHSNLIAKPQLKSSLDELALHSPNPTSWPSNWHLIQPPIRYSLTYKKELKGSAKCLCTQAFFFGQFFSAIFFTKNLWFQICSWTNRSNKSQ